MTVTTLGIAHIQPIVSLIAGILILVMPQLLNYIVAIFLIVGHLGPRANPMMRMHSSKTLIDEIMPAHFWRRPAPYDTLGSVSV